MQTGSSASGMAITALVLGIVSYFICPLIGGIAAWIVGKMELSKIERGESPEAGKGMAKVGMWLGIINVVLNILAGIALIIYFVFLAAVISTTSH
jgi:large-conductance mechanosensitive channel